ncbi:MAG: Do family serine endopeptidase [Deltaproteobacteria bacterium]|jgi:serine protease Do|nr:Do family serine endopeptidase [Deltaproteobacteria bacterium]
MRARHSIAIACALLCLSLALPLHAAGLPDFTLLAKNCGIAVVNIGTERTSKSGPENFFGEMFRNAPPGFEKFFEQFERFHDGQQQQRPQRKQRSLGSGFIISEDGYIVTNYHVVADADVIRINFQGSSTKNESVVAKLIGSDEETDLALLKVDAKEKLPFLKFGDSDALQVGAWVLAIGNPFGLDHTVTAGILSAKGRNIHSGPFDNFLQTDASINPGNSGGPLINMSGEVIGINTAIIASGQGIGFAIPSSMASKIVDQIKDGKKIRRGWIGVTIQDVDQNSAKALGLDKAHGALIGSVMPGEPADKAGVKAGDVILFVDGKDIADSSALLRTIAGKAPGAEIRIIVWRDGKSHELGLTLGERTPEQLSAQRGGPGKPGKNTEADILGISVRPVTAEEARTLKLEKNQGGLMVVSVSPGKPAADNDIRQGDVIVSANLKPLKTAQDLVKIVTEDAKERGAVMLQINRRGQLSFRAIPLAK